MRKLIQDFINELKAAKPYSNEEDKLAYKYAKLAESKLNANGELDYLFCQLVSEIHRITSQTEGCLTEKQLCEKYEQLAMIQAIVKYGDVLSIEDFIESVKVGGFIPYDGEGYYWDETRQEETKEPVSFDIKELQEKSNTYKYVIWYNK
jgi:hypothetical protein